MKTVCIFCLVCIKNRLAGFAYGVKYFANSAHQHEQAVEDAGKDEDEGKEVAEELEVAVKHFEVRSTRWEVRSGKDGLRITNYELRVTNYPASSRGSSPLSAPRQAKGGGEKRVMCGRRGRGGFPGRWR